MLDHIQLEKYLIREALESFAEIWDDLIVVEAEERERCLRDTGLPADIVRYVLKGISVDWGSDIEQVPHGPRLPELLLRCLNNISHEITASAHSAQTITSSDSTVICGECGSEFGLAGIVRHMTAKHRPPKQLAETSDLSHLKIACPHCPLLLDTEVELRIHSKQHGMKVVSK